MTARNITLAFFSPRKDGEDWVNKLTARASKYPYCHVELYFETTNQSFSIQLGEKAGLRTKTLSSDCYEYVTLSVSLKEYDGMLDFCRKTSQLGLDFDNRGMWLSYFYLGGISGGLGGMGCLGGKPCDSKSLGKTTCSKIVCEALQYGGVEEVEGMNPCNATPSRLYGRILHSKRRVIASVPYKRMQMMQKRVVCFNQKVYFRVNDIET